MVQDPERTLREPCLHVWGHAAMWRSVPGTGGPQASRYSHPQLVGGLTVRSSMALAASSKDDAPATIAYPKTGTTSSTEVGSKVSPFSITQKANRVIEGQWPSANATAPVCSRLHPGRQSKLRQKSQRQ